MKISKCRICNSDIVRVLSLGKFPAVNYYLSRDDLKRKEKKYSLNFCICEICGLGQLDEIVQARKLFSTYHYISSTSIPLKKHLEALGELCRKKFKLNNASSVLDIGCNDGTLLKHINKFGTITLGIDPAKNVVEQTKKTGVKVISNYFTEKLSKKILKKEGLFDLIFATNTLAQIIDLNDFVSGVKNLLKIDGSFIVEVGHLPEMLSKKTFDSIYHEHYSYFSLMSLNYLFGRNGLEIYDAQEIGNHGGSLRVFVKHKKNKRATKTARLKNILEKEHYLKINSRKSYAKFVSNVLNFKNKFRKLLISLKKTNATIVGVGAPAKSVILLNFTKIDHTIISYITDSTPYKQNRFMPGVHIPIISENKLNYDKSIDYFLLLAWTYKDAIIEKIRLLKNKNAKIIIPFPELIILQ